MAKSLKFRNKFASCLIEADRKFEVSRVSRRSTDVKRWKGFEECRKPNVENSRHGVKHEGRTVHIEKTFKKSILREEYVNRERKLFYEKKGTRTVCVEESLFNRHGRYNYVR